MSIGKAIGAYSMLGRVSNLPTCVTNVLVGTALAINAGGTPRPETFTLVLLSVILFYIGGMALNDVVDARHDIESGAKRPIPLGLITRKNALVVTVLCFVGAMLCAVRLGQSAIGAASLLCLCIVAYDLLHKRWAIFAVYMGLCRGLIYPYVVVAMGGTIHDSTLWWFVGAMTAYTTFVTLVARREHARPTTPVGWGALALLAPFVAFVGVDGFPLVPSLISGLLLVVWSVRNLKAGQMGRAKAAVMGWLAGMCIVDAFFLAALGETGAMIVAMVAFVFTALWHKRIAGT